MPLFEQKQQHIPSTLLKDKFGWPPFSILNTISWDWQRRKDEWENLYHNSTVGRDVKRYNATPTNTFSARGANAKQPESVSEFDPYLCELMYRWFSTPNAYVLDPFAGGCVRGLVASVLGRHYTGIDLSDTQVCTNQEQYKQFKSQYVDVPGSANWITGDAEKVLYDCVLQNQTSDSYNINTVVECADEPNGFSNKSMAVQSKKQGWRHRQQYDMVFTCPPYYNLEVYTSDPADLSRAKSYEDFLQKYTSILQYSASMLKPDSFFVIVVSEIRASAADISKSYYHGFVADTIKALQTACGLRYYNEIILENAIGSLPIRAPKYFIKTRKIGKHHQNILVFYKGDINNIESKFGEINF